MSVAFIRAGLSPFVSAGADHVAGFELDQFLHHETHRVSDQIDTITGAECVEKLGQGSSINWAEAHT